MNEYIAMDVHKHYSLAERWPLAGGPAVLTRLPHDRGVIAKFLAGEFPGGGGPVEPQTSVAFEATGNWYNVADEIEQARCTPRLVHPRQAKMRMARTNKTDRLDVHGLNILQRNGTLPCVWIPPAPLRDLRELTRTRMVFTRMRTKLKNRIHANLAKYFLTLTEPSDIFGKKSRPALEERIAQLPPMTRWCTSAQLDELGKLDEKIAQMEAMIRGLVEHCACEFPTIGKCGGGTFQWLEPRVGVPELPALRLLKSLPGVGDILATVLLLELGDVNRFANAEHLASYAGCAPRVSSSGGHTRIGRMRSDVNRYIKWACFEAANVIALQQRRKLGRHVDEIYARVRRHKGHAKAVGAVGHHLAETAFHVLKRKETYRERKNETACSTRV
jgi:transposase